MVTRSLLLLTLLVGSPISAQVPDSIPVPYPVAIGGAFWHVLSDFDPTSQHTTLHGALREAGLRLIEGHVRGEPSDVRVCTDMDGDGACYRMELRWVHFEREADSVIVVPGPDPDPEPDPDPAPEIVEPDSLWIDPPEAEMLVGQELPFTVISWHDDRPWVCVWLEGSLGYLAIRQELGRWIWDYPVPEFRPAPEACDLTVTSTDPDIAEVTWTPGVLDELPTRAAQWRLQTASGSGQTATATLAHTPEAGNLLVAMLWHRVDWRTPMLQSDREWQMVALHVEDAEDVGNTHRKGLAVWIRRAGPDDPTTLSATWAELTGNRGTHLIVWELAGYGDFQEAVIESGGGVSTDHLPFQASAAGALVGLAGTRDRALEAFWGGLELGQRLGFTEGEAAVSTIFSALGAGDSATLFLGEAFPALGVLLRFAEGPDR